LIDSQTGTGTGRTRPADPPPGRPVPRAIRWEPAGRQAGARASVDADDIELPPKPWNRNAIISPFLALVCAPAGLCVALVAAGQIGLGRQRGIGFAVAGIVIGSLVPVVVCGWGLLH
jgi:hypothetical protein